MRPKHTAATIRTNLGAKRAGASRVSRARAMICPPLPKSRLAAMSTPIKVTRRFEGKVGLVTGGASGIGLAISRRLVAEGASVVVADVNDASLKRTKAELGSAIATTTVDVRVEAQVETMVRTATERFGQLDVAFNAAGLGGFG